ncbi:MAG: LysR family transcriptional regulator [Clostridiales bacterium]|nr:LysR family transcriptional regulator [Clostridiales bacterium]
MELKQLEFFIAASECGSLSKAAEKLYTSQPNVSKVIRMLEEELGTQLFERTSRGLRLTPYGKSIYDYALNIVKNANLIKSTDGRKNRDTLYISTYQSNVIAKLLTGVYNNHENMSIEHRQGTIEEIINHVEHGVSEIGILYVSQKHLTAFQNIIGRKDLEFVSLGKLKACIYAGPKSLVYHKDSITYDELAELRYIRGLSDFFSIDDGLEQISLGVVNSDILNPAVYTNSEHLATNLLLQTDLVEIGIDLDIPNYSQYDMKNLAIEGKESYLTLGYVTEKGHAISSYANELIESLKEILKP